MSSNVILQNLKDVYHDNVSLVMFCITARKELSFPSVSSNVILENLKDVYRDNVSLVMFLYYSQERVIFPFCEQ